jgi:hypothetical protein
LSKWRERATRKSRNAFAGSSTSGATKTGSAIADASSPTVEPIAKSKTELTTSAMSTAGTAPQTNVRPTSQMGSRS